MEDAGIRTRNYPNHFRLGSCKLLKNLIKVPSLMKAKTPILVLGILNQSPNKILMSTHGGSIR